jgi:hypothetical protein
MFLDDIVSPLTVKEAATDYQKRRQRERDVDAGKPVSRQAKNPQTDYAKKRARDKKELELGEEQVNELSKGTLANYVKANANDQVQHASSQSYVSGKNGDKYNTADAWDQRTTKREKGMDRALNKVSQVEEDSWHAGDNAWSSDKNQWSESMDASEPSPVTGAITRRILSQRLDLLKQYGPELVGAAIDNVADYVGDVDEIGSSDVSAWVAQVERMLRDNPPEAFDQDMEEGVWDNIKKSFTPDPNWQKRAGQQAGHMAQGAVAGGVHGHAVGHSMADAGVAEGQLDELDMFAPVTTYVRLANGTYVAANWRRNQNLSTASNSASFIDIKPLAPNVAKQLGLDQRLNDPEKKYTGATTIASGGPIQASDPFSDKTINVVDIRDPKAAKDSGVPDTLFGKIAQWAQQQGQKEQGVAEGISNDMSTKDMIAYLKQHHDKNLHQDYLDHINTFSKFVLQNIPVNSIKTDLPELDRAKVEQYKQMDFSKAPPIVMGGGYILDGYHRANVAKALGIPSIKAYVGIKGQQGVAEGNKLKSESRLNELVILEPRTTYIKMDDGTWVKSEYRESGQDGQETASFTSMQWVSVQTAKSLGLEKHLETNMKPSGLVTSQTNGRHVTVVSFTDPKPGSVIPDGVKNKIFKWVEKNPAPANAIPTQQDVKTSMAGAAAAELKRTPQDIKDAGVEKTQRQAYDAAKSQVNELFEPTLNYYKLSNGKTVQVSYRPNVNQSPVPFTDIKITYVNPALKPQGPSFDSTGVAEPWTRAPDGVKQAIQKFVTQPQQGVAEGGYNDYNNNRKGFSRPGREDDEYHVPDPVETQYNIKVNGEVINRQPFANRAEALTWAKQAVAAGKLDPKNAKLSPINQVNELSNDKLASYKKAAGADATAADKRGDFEHGNKRFRGIVKATVKQGDNDAKKHVKESYWTKLENERNTKIAKLVNELKESVK